MDSPTTTTNNNNNKNGSVNVNPCIEPDGNNNNSNNISDAIANPYIETDGNGRMTDAGISQFQQALSRGDSVFLYSVSDQDWGLLIERLGEEKVLHDFATYVTPDGRSRGTEIATQGFRGNNNINIDRRGILKLTPARFQFFKDNLTPAMIEQLFRHDVPMPMEIVQAFADAGVTKLEKQVFLSQTPIFTDIHYVNGPWDSESDSDFEA